VNVEVVGVVDMVDVVVNGDVIGDVGDVTGDAT